MSETIEVFDESERHAEDDIFCELCGDRIPHDHMAKGIIKGFNSQGSFTVEPDADFKVVCLSCSGDRE